MKKPRLRTLGLWLAAFYFAFSLLVYVGSYGHRDHAWWPMFLYPVIFPFGWLFEEALKPLLRAWLVPATGTVTEEVWMTLDHIAGLFYVIVGTSWLWCVGKIVSAGVTRFFPLEREIQKEA
jgi:hypothetical protein